MAYKELRDKLIKRLKEREGEMIELRRYFHENPELSFQEKETSEFIAKFYEGKDCKVQSNFGGGYGLVVDIQGGKPGKNLALRGDMDALPIEEQAGLDFKSKNPGVMHACGHDAHTAYLMIVADTLIELKSEIPGNIRIIHQPAEEVAPGGALGMVNAGVVKGFDGIIGAHIITDMKLGEIGYREGAVQTGRANFTIEFEGKGGHASAPHKAHDTIVGASYFVTALQTVISRRVNPFDTASVTIGSFDAKGIPNIIKHTVELKGDVRIMQEENRPLIEAEIRKIAEGACIAFDMKATIKYENDYVVLINDEDLTNIAIEGIKDAQLDRVTNIFRCEPQTASEDFSYYAKEIPGFFFYIGAVKEGEVAYPHHHPNFYIDESAILIMAEAVSSGALAFLFSDK